MDIELEYAHRLGDVLRDMRRELTDDATRRLFLWATERWGMRIVVMGIDPVKTVRRPAPAPAPAENTARPVVELPPEPEAVNGNTNATCHVCGKGCADNRGLSGHMRIAHKMKWAPTAGA